MFLSSASSAKKSVCVVFLLYCYSPAGESPWTADFQDLTGIRKDTTRKIKAFICTVVAGGFPRYSDKYRVPQHCDALTHHFLQPHFVYLGIFLGATKVGVFFPFCPRWFGVVFLNSAVKELFHQSPSGSPPEQSFLSLPGVGSSQLRRKMDIAYVILETFDITSWHGLLHRKLFCIVCFITFWDY